MARSHKLPTAAWPNWSVSGFYEDHSYDKEVKRACKLAIKRRFLQTASEALRVPGLPVIYFASEAHADSICRRLACRVWSGLAADGDPFSTPLTDAERAACAEWLQLSGGEVADRLVSEHVVGASEVARCTALQQVLDARGVALDAAQLPGINLSNQAGSRLRAGKPVAATPEQPYCARLQLMPELAAAMEADASLPETSAASIRTGNQAGSTKFYAHNLFADVAEAVIWRDQQFFKAYGTCASLQPLLSS